MGLRHPIQTRLFCKMQVTSEHTPFISANKILFQNAFIVHHKMHDESIVTHEECCVLQRIAVCCSESQCIAVSCSVLQCVAASCSVLHCHAMHHKMHDESIVTHEECCVLQRIAACCSVLQLVAAYCSVLQ